MNGLTSQLPESGNLARPPELQRDFSRLTALKGFMRHCEQTRDDTRTAFATRIKILLALWRKYLARIGGAQWLERTNFRII